MADADIEIEIKVPLDKDEFLSIQEKLKKVAEFLKQEQQVDDYFTPVHRNFLKPEFPFEWLRLRKCDCSSSVTYKRYYPEHEEVHTHCDEFETEVSDVEKLRKIFDSIDVKKLVTVDKARVAFIYGDFEIVLDDVKELGYFVEIEALKDFGGVEATRQKIFDVAREFGIDVSKCDLRGYPNLLMRKKGLL